jgi:hypothetical protein
MEAFDIGKDIAFRVLACCMLLVMDLLGIECVEEAFRRCIVPAVGLRLMETACWRTEARSGNPSKRTSGRSEWWIRLASGRRVRWPCSGLPTAVRS